MSHLLQTLYYLSAYTYLPTSALLLISKNPKVMYRVLDSAEINGLIKQSRICEYIKHSPRYTTYYSITKQGLEYLKSSKINLNDASWIEIVSSKDYHKDVFRDSSDKIKKLTKNAISLLLNIINIPTIYSSTLVSNNSENLTQPLSLQTLNQSTQNSDKIQYLIQPLYNQEFSTILTQQFNYTPSELVKSTLIEARHNAKEYRSGRYAGILETPQQSFLIYPGSKLGTQGTKWTLQNEHNAIHYYTKTKSQFNNLPPGIQYGIMFVDNSRMFNNLFLDKWQLRGGQIGFGLDCESFAIFPITRFGAENFYHYITNDINRINNIMLASCLESGYVENKGRWKNYFPLYNPATNKYVYLGSIIDNVKMCSAMEIQKTQLKSPIELIGYEWQEEYYTPHLDISEFIFIPKDL